jgi:RHS repeat-associated protein
MSAQPLLNNFFYPLEIIHSKKRATEKKKRVNYYPFGLRHKGYNNIINGTHYPYTYNGKEEQEELGLNWIDYGWRNYDAALGRWMGIDNLAEKYISSSPYHYAANNPISNYDIDGNEFSDDEYTQNTVNSLRNSYESNRDRAQGKVDELNAIVDSGGTLSRGQQRKLNRNTRKLDAANSALGELDALASDQDVTFTFVNSDMFNEGDNTTATTVYNTSTNSVNIIFDERETSIGKKAHELKHAHQFLTGETSLQNFDGSNLTSRAFLHDQTDEAAAQYRQKSIYGTDSHSVNRNLPASSITSSNSTRVQALINSGRPEAQIMQRLKQLSRSQGTFRVALDNTNPNTRTTITPNN